MKIRVTKRDIEAGRTRADTICGCPIWHAINRQLGLQLSVDDDSLLLTVPKMEQAKLGRLKLRLPRAAIEMQQILRELPHAKVKPFEFEAEFE